MFHWHDVFELFALLHFCSCLFCLITGPFRHMINPYTDVEDVNSRPVSRGGWATYLSQLPPLRGTPRDPETTRPASRSDQLPRPVSRGSFLSRPSGFDSPNPPPYTETEKPDIRPRTSIISRRESRPGNC